MTRLIQKYNLFQVISFIQPPNRSMSCHLMSCHLMSCHLTSGNRALCDIIKKLFRNSKQPVQSTELMVQTIVKSPVSGMTYATC